LKEKEIDFDLFGIPKRWFLTSVWLAGRQTGFGRRVARTQDYKRRAGSRKRVQGLEAGGRVESSGQGKEGGSLCRTRGVD